MSDTLFSLFDNFEDRDTHYRKVRIFDIVQNIYGTEYLPKAKEVYEWVLTHEAQYQNIVLSLVEQLAPTHLKLTEFDDDLAALKTEIRNTFEWLHDRALS